MGDVEAGAKKVGSLIVLVVLDRLVEGDEIRLLDSELVDE
jgi:hypothetical protein